MAASYMTARVCPFHGQRIRLADCPIVVTNPDAEAELKSLAEDGEFTFPRDDMRARDGQTRAVVAPPPSANPPESKQRGVVGKYFLGDSEGMRLPTPDELTSRVPVHGLEARRACPTCGIPLPDLVDDRDIFTVVVAGITEASKSTMLTRLCRLTSTGRSFTDLGFSEFVETEYSADTLDELERRVLGGDRLDRTDRPVMGGAYEPWVFRVTGSRTRRPLLLFMHDVAGETFQDPSIRSREAPFLAWADAVVFLVDPKPYLDPQGSAARNQARVLEGTIRAVRNPKVPFAVALAKADLLGVELDRSALGNGERVKEELRRIGAGAVVDAGATRAGTSFHFLAAHPEVGFDEPRGVVEVFSAVAGRCGLI